MSTIRYELPSIVGFLLFGIFHIFADHLHPDAIGLTASLLVLAFLFAVMVWCSFSVVRHAGGLATLLGEPYGTLILTLAVTGIEVALISAVMLSGDAKPTLARETMFSVVMIVLTGLVGLCLLLGGLRQKAQEYNLQGANAFLSVLIPLAVLALVLPRVTPSAPGGELSTLQTIFDIVMSVVLYGVFLIILTKTHSDLFRQPGAAPGEEEHHGGAVRSVGFHVAGLFGALLPIILLAETLAEYADHGIHEIGAPVALGGFLVAVLILMPEGVSAIKAARENKLQRSINICLGAALATIGLTVPAVLAIGWLTNKTVELGLDVEDIVLLILTLFLSSVTFGSRQTNYLQGAVHLALFGAYVMMIFDLA
ncbi:calcium:proton antiporter [Roseibium litorale]|uniref:Calcium:proton antiporter n=1 Tax=Roseibium litorale TaxID=2803841 RepID=A0ABR9CGR2_9HYPH|nr:calcium:proton antiporter [Roseibium litorale]MBD8889968.1 calcium:proton antiporter [Roseibium litorale]